MGQFDSDKNKKIKAKNKLSACFFVFMPGRPDFKLCQKLPVLLRGG